MNSGVIFWPSCGHVPVSYAGWPTETSVTAARERFADGLGALRSFAPQQVRMSGRLVHTTVNSEHC